MDMCDPEISTCVIVYKQLILLDTSYLSASYSELLSFLLKHLFAKTLAYWNETE